MCKKGRAYLQLVLFLIVSTLGVCNAVHRFWSGSWVSRKRLAGLYLDHLTLTSGQEDFRRSVRWRWRLLRGPLDLRSKMLGKGGGGVVIRLGGHSGRECEEGTRRMFLLLASPPPFAYSV